MSCLKSSATSGALACRRTKQFAAWRTQLHDILSMMHGCNVVHMDLMPCNIAWRLVDGAVHIKLLDFDAASSLPFRVGPRLQTQVLTMNRKLMWQEQLVPNVRFDWWIYFLYCRMPASCRVGAPVSGAKSPALVNGPLVRWLEELEQAESIAVLREAFSTEFVIDVELDMESWQ